MLDGDLEIVESDVLEHARLLQRGGHERLGGRTAVLGVQLLVERARVHADAQGDPRIGGRLADRGAHFIEFADVARIDAHRGAARVDRLENVFALEVNVRDDRNRRFPHDFRQRVGILLLGHRHADDVAARRGEFRDLLQGGRHVGGARVGHGLHGDRRSTADRHRTDHDAARFAAGMERAFADGRLTGFAERLVKFWHKLEILAIEGLPHGEPLR